MWDLRETEESRVKPNVFDLCNGKNRISLQQMEKIVGGFGEEGKQR